MPPLLDSSLAANPYARPPSPASRGRNATRRMALENGWGATRIHGELLRLDIEISERSVSRYLRSLPHPPRSGRSWMTFLKNHRQGIAAMDLFTAPTATFRVLYALFVIGHRREVAWFGVTLNPTAAWVVQQSRGLPPRQRAQVPVLFARARSFSAEVASTLRSMSVEPVRTGFRRPWQKDDDSHCTSSVQSDRTCCSSLRSDSFFPCCLRGAAPSILA